MMPKKLVIDREFIAHWEERARTAVRWSKITTPGRRAYYQGMADGISMMLSDFWHRENDPKLKTKNPAVGRRKK